MSQNYKVWLYLTEIIWTAFAIAFTIEFASDCQIGCADAVLENNIATLKLSQADKLQSIARKTFRPLIFEFQPSNGCLVMLS
mgnify:CR=1 FL=1